MTQTGELAAWGSAKTGPFTSAPPGTDFRLVAAGGNDQSLAIRSSGKLELWGDGLVPDLTGRLANDSFSDAALGLGCILAIRSDNDELEVDGDLLTGMNTTAKIGVPPSLKGVRVSGVAAGGGHAVAIRKADGGLEGWGSVTTCPNGAFTKVRARHGYTIALSVNGDLYGWGEPLFPDATPGFPVPERLTHLLGAGWESNPLRGAERPAYDHRWRRDKAGFLFVPGKFIDLAIGARESQSPSSDPHILALRPDGTVNGWGANGFGQAKAPYGIAFKAITAGRGYSIGIDPQGTLKAWGMTGSWSTTPTGPFSSIGSGVEHVAAIGGGFLTLKPVKSLKDLAEE